MKETAVITSVVDRIEGNVIVCSDDRTSHERYLPREQYPHLAVCDVLRLTLDGDTVLSLEVLTEETECRKSDMQKRLHALFNRRKKS